MCLKKDDLGISRAVREVSPNCEGVQGLLHFHTRLKTFKSRVMGRYIEREPSSGRITIILSHGSWSCFSMRPPAKLSVQFQVWVLRSGDEMNNKLCLPNVLAIQCFAAEVVVVFFLNKDFSLSDVLLPVGKIWTNMAKFYWQNNDFQCLLILNCNILFSIY